MGRKRASRPAINKSAHKGLGAANSFLWSRLNRPKRSSRAIRTKDTLVSFKVGVLRVSWDTTNGLVTLEIEAGSQSIKVPIKYYGAKETLAVELLRDKRFLKKPYWLTGKGTKDAIIAGLASLHPKKPLKFTPFPGMYAAKRLLLCQLPKKPLTTLAKIASENTKVWSDLISHMAETGNACFLKLLGRYLKNPQQALDPLDIKIAAKILELKEAKQFKTNKELALSVGSDAETVRKRRKAMGL